MSKFIDSTGLGRIISNIKTNFAAKVHSHGNIANDGAVTNTAVSIASGDKIAVVDSSDSNKVASTDLTFDGTSTDYALSKSGSWEQYNYYTLPTASSSEKGGIKVGSGLTITDGVLSVDSNTSGGTAQEMVVLSYGSSTWNDFITAFNKNAIVYCRASSGADPAVGAQLRMAFLAYVNADPPTQAEFQYYRSVSSHSNTQQGDQIFIYKLQNNNTWSVTLREAASKIVAGSGLTSSYNNGVLTISLA